VEKHIIGDDDYGDMRVVMGILMDINGAKLRGKGVPRE
jgi:hypothetical protein